MKKNLAGLMVVFLMLLVPCLATGAGKSSVELGKKLFNDPALGGSPNSQSCNSCHPDGRGIENSGDNPNLTRIINKCIVTPLKGKKLDGRTVKMRSLKMYIKSLAE